MINELGVTFREVSRNVKSTYIKIDNNMSELPTPLRVFSAVVVGTIVGGCIDQAIHTSSQEKEMQDKAFASFAAEHPELKDREMYLIGHPLPLNSGADIITIPTNDVEKAEIDKIPITVNGEDLPVYDGAKVFTLKINPDNSQEWVELRGVYKSTNPGLVETDWYVNTPSGELSRKVFSYSSGDEINIWPLNTPPNSISWAPDLKSRNIKDYSPWDGTKPFTVILNLNMQAAGKPLLAPMPFDVITPTPLTFATNNGLVTVTPDGSIATTETPAPAEVHPENVQAVEKATGLPMILSEDKSYAYFQGDPNRLYQLPIDTAKYDQFTWTINGEPVVFQNVGQDIVNKGTDANGNKVSWIQGFSVTKDSKTGEIKFDLVAVGRPHGKEAAKDVLPSFTRFEVGSKEDTVAMENIKNYLDAVDEKYPPRNLYPSDISTIIPGNIEVSTNTALKNTFQFTRFFPQSNNKDDLDLLWQYNNNPSFGGGADGDLTGNYSPYQLAREGIFYSPMPLKYDKENNIWETLTWSLYIINSDGKSFTRIQCVEDSVTQDGKQIGEVYDNLDPTDSLVPIILLESSKTKMSAITKSNRIGNWVVDQIRKYPINMAQNRVPGKNVIFSKEVNTLNQNIFLISSLPDVSKTPFLLN